MTTQTYLRRLAVVATAALLTAPAAGARILEESGIGEPVGESVVIVQEDRFDWLDAGVGAASTAALALGLGLAAVGARSRSSRQLRNVA